jgi:GH24 family phage-related lysozyme (muramidase)
METWLERANRWGDVLPSNASLTHVQAGLASDIKDKILYAIKLGLGTGAILAMLNVSGPDWESLVEKMRSDPIITDQQLEDSIEDVELPWRVMDIPQEDDSTQQYDYESFANYIGAHEGSVPYVYDDATGGRWYGGATGNPTIGIGHLIDDESREVFQEVFGDEVDYDDIVERRAELTETQIAQLFRHDVQDRLGVAENLFPNFSTYPTDVQSALLDGVYRGGLSGSPATIRLINSGDWIGAADEYLNNNEYRAAVRSGSGVAPRMEQNRDVFLQYGRHLAD